MNPKKQEPSNENISRDESPGPSDKSSGSKEVDDCDEKNPDVVPESIEPDEQVRLKSDCTISLYHNSYKFL